MAVWRSSALQHQTGRAAIVITLIVLAGAAALAAALNALAGGGSLVTFPALLFVGLNPIDANASSVLVLFPATFASVWAYRGTSSTSPKSA